ncbi:transcription factor Adf-1-like [Maniola jurtina]|uniref:transcription factor Adf-1-like n=1 Tax=Maniola jurtina TaxID=191418 RepID=UPI001E68681E|nr:transcription factor Adf-1-like [Maniola jurtina]
MSKMTARNPKLSRKTLLNIVQEVHKRPCLWNPDDENHNNRARMAVAWEEITSALNIPEPLVKAKWKIMRDIFKREMKRCKMNSHGKFQYTGKWRHFKLLWFVHKNKEAQLVQCDPAEDSYSSTEENNIKEEVIDNNSTDVDESHDHNVPFEESNMLTLDFEPEQDPLPVQRRQSSEDDYDLMFLKSLVPYFRELDPVRKLRLRSTILDIIINEISGQPQGILNSTR